MPSKRVSDDELEEIHKQCLLDRAPSCCFYNCGFMCLVSILFAYFIVIWVAWDVVREKGEDGEYVPIDAKEAVQDKAVNRELIDDLMN